MPPRVVEKPGELERCPIDDIFNLKRKPLVDLNAILAEKRAQDQQEITPWQKQPHKKQQQSAAATPAANTTTTTPAAAIVAGPSHTPGHTVQLNVVPQLLCRTLPDAPPDALPSTVDAIRPPASLVPTFPDSMTIDQVACTVLQSGWIMAQACRTGIVEADVAQWLFACISTCQSNLRVIDAACDTLCKLLQSRPSISIAWYPTTTTILNTLHTFTHTIHHTHNPTPVPPTQPTKPPPPHAACVVALVTVFACIYTPSGKEASSLSTPKHDHAKLKGAWSQHQQHQLQVLFQSVEARGQSGQRGQGNTNAHGETTNTTRTKARKHKQQIKQKQKPKHARTHDDDTTQPMDTDTPSHDTPSHDTPSSFTPVWCPSYAVIPPVAQLLGTLLRLSVDPLLQAWSCQCIHAAVALVHVLPEGQWEECFGAMVHEAAHCMGPHHHAAINVLLSLPDTPRCDALRIHTAAHILRTLVHAGTENTATVHAVTKNTTAAAAGNGRTAPSSDPATTPLPARMLPTTTVDVGALLEQLSFAGDDASVRTLLTTCRNNSARFDLLDLLAACNVLALLCVAEHKTAAENHAQQQQEQQAAQGGDTKTPKINTPKTNTPKTARRGTRSGGGNGGGNGTGNATIAGSASSSEAASASLGSAPPTSLGSAPLGGPPLSSAASQQVGAVLRRIRERIAAMRQRKAAGEGFSDEVLTIVNGLNATEKMLSWAGFQAGHS